MCYFLEAGKCTVQNEVGAGGESRCVARKIDADGAQFFGFAQPAHGCHSVPLSDQGLKSGRGEGQIRADVAGADAVDPDTLLGPFDGQGLGELDHACLGSVVSALGLRHVDDVGRHGSRVDDAAAAVGKHVPACDGISQEDTVEVYIDVLLPLGVGHLVSCFVDADTGVGVAEVQTAKLRYDCVHHGLYISFVGHVALEGDDLPAGGFSDLFSCFLSCFQIHVHDSDISACFRESQCGALANASRSSGNKALLAGEAHLFQNSHNLSSFS